MKTAIIFWVSVVTISAIVLVLMFATDETDRQEAEAEVMICRSMAAEVLVRDASRFDYMGTRCPARFLVPTGEN